MVSAMDSKSNSSDSSPDVRGHSVVFLGEELYFLSASFHPCVYKGGSKLLGQLDRVLGNHLRWTNIPSRGSSNTSGFMLRKVELISTCICEPVGI